MQVCHSSAIVPSVTFNIHSARFGFVLLGADVSMMRVCVLKIGMSQVSVVGSNRYICSLYKSLESFCLALLEISQGCMSHEPCMATAWENGQPEKGAPLLF
eukprot:6454736-Amphidinium_carterae.3